MVINWIWDNAMFPIQPTEVKQIWNFWESLLWAIHMLQLGVEVNIIKDAQEMESHMKRLLPYVGVETAVADVSVCLPAIECLQTYLCFYPDFVLPVRFN
jgi:hypothetical protein